MKIFADNLFLGKVALITGGGTGIGRGIAEALARHGADVAIVSRKQENLTAAAEQIAQSNGRRCLPLVADVRQPEAVESAVNQAVSELGGLDIVVNNAAGNFFCASADLSPNGFGTVLDIDAKGTWNVSRAAYQARFKEHGGQILNISATLHYGGTPGPASRRRGQGGRGRPHAARWPSSGGRWAFASMRSHPGPIGDTEGARRLFPGKVGEMIKSATPTGRIGTIEDIVNLAIFMLSDAGIQSQWCDCRLGWRPVFDGAVYAGVGYAGSLTTEMSARVNRSPVIFWSNPASMHRDSPSAPDRNRRTVA